MTEPEKRTTQQVGRCGELLVQYKLLKHGVDSAPMTTDYGIDLVAFAHKTQPTVTIQVKATERHHTDATSAWVEWAMPKKCIADYVAVVDLERDKAWLLGREEFESASQRTTDEGRRLWWYVPEPRYDSREPKRMEEHYEEYRMDSSIPKVFGLE